MLHFPLIPKLIDNMITVDKYGSTNYNYDMFSYIKQITYKYHINFEKKNVSSFNCFQIARKSTSGG